MPPIQLVIISIAIGILCRVLIPKQPQSVIATIAIITLLFAFGVLH